MDLNNTTQVNARLLSPASYELFEELNVQFQGGCPIEEICQFIEETEWQESLNTAIREESIDEELHDGEDLTMDIFSGNDLIGKV